MATISEGNRQAGERMRAHHRAMLDAVRARVGALSADGSTWTAARDALVAHVEAEVLPHARAEEATVYERARDYPHLRGLVDAMVREHGAIASLTGALAAARSPADALRIAGGIEQVFAVHAGIENDVMLPALEADPAVDLGAVLEDMPAVADGDVDLDVGAIPHAQRHRIILGLVERLRPGQALVITVDHDPLPLRRQIEAIHGDGLRWTYRARGPRLWRIAIRRPASRS